MRPRNQKHMHACALFLITVMTIAVAHAAFIPYYRMDSLAFQADLVVLCKERGYAPRHDASIETALTWRTGTFVVERTFKGSVPAGKTVIVRMSGTYRRALLGEGIPTYVRQKDGRSVMKPMRPIALGQALLFLTWNKTEKTYEPVTGGIKLITEGKVLAFGQFVSNPGPLVLAPMKPENVSVPRYDLKELLADLVVGLDKAKRLKAPVRGKPEYFKE